MSFNKSKPVPDKNDKGMVLMTEKYACEISEFNGYYYQAKLNQSLHLHYKAFTKIENLNNFINLKTLYLENNCITKIENLSHMKSLSCLYLHNNLIEKIENLDENTNISTLNLAGNRIKEITGLANLKNLSNLYLEKNGIEEVEKIKGVLECPSIQVLDIASNYIEKGEEQLLLTLLQMENLKVLYLRGNDIIRTIKNYRKFLIFKLKNLTYLDDRPVDQGDRLGSDAFFRDGLEEERKVREEYRKSKDTGYKIRKMESEIEKASFQERKEKAMIALHNDYLKKKDYLENKKRKLIKDIQNNPQKKIEISREILAVDYQMKENEKLKVDDERDIIFSMAKREKFNSYSTFEYETWMDPILINNVVENMFDFTIALKLIQLELKNRNVTNYELFSEFELRIRWTELELKFFRKNESNENKNKQFHNEVNFSKIQDAEKDKRIIISGIKDSSIEENIFLNSNDIKNISNHKNGDINVQKLEELKIEEKKSQDKSKGFIIEIKEEKIDFSELD